MPLFDRIFTAHPASVDETYLEHMGVATSFGVRMILGGLACCVHGLIPAAFERTGSNQVRVLHDRMVANRAARHHTSAEPVARDR